MKKAVSWIVPEGVLFTATLLLAAVPTFRKALPDFIWFDPYAVAIVGGLLAWRFQRSRVLLALVILALANWAIRESVELTDAVGARVIYEAAAVLVPLNIAALALLPERRITTWRGLVRLVFIGLQVVIVEVFRRTAAPATAAWLGRALVHLRWLGKLPLAQSGIVAFAVALAVVLVFVPSPSRRTVLWALATTGAAFTVSRAGPGPALYLGTAGLILVIAVIEASYLLAYQDGLTQLPARRALSEAMAQIGGQYAVAMIDVDHFKQFNDKYGHDVGDQVLRMVAAKLGGVLGGGRAYRYGGEEFAILFPGKTVEDAVPHLETVRRAVADGTFTIRRRLRPRRKPDTPKRRSTRREVSITVSIGVAAPNGRHASPEQVIQAADRALYVAKGEGRNRTRIANGKAAVH